MALPLRTSGFGRLASTLHFFLPFLTWVPVSAGSCVGFQSTMAALLVGTCSAFATTSAVSATNYALRWNHFLHFHPVALQTFRLYAPVFVAGFRNTSSAISVPSAPALNSEDLVRVRKVFDRGTSL